MLRARARLAASALSAMAALFLMSARSFGDDPKSKSPVYFPSGTDAFARDPDPEEELARLKAHNQALILVLQMAAGNEISAVKEVSAFLKDLETEKANSRALLKDLEAEKAKVEELKDFGRKALNSFRRLEQIDWEQRFWSVPVNLFTFFAPFGWAYFGLQLRERKHSAFIATVLLTFGVGFCLVFTISLYARHVNPDYIWVRHGEPFVFCSLSMGPILALLVAGYFSWRRFSRA